MLSYLQIRDFGLIDRVELEFGSGLTVLTGETGAGKSMLVDALGLVLGDRAEPRQVRHSCSRAEISAEFDIGDQPELHTWLVEQGLDDGMTCLVRRVIAREGRSRAFLNGTPVTVQLLAELGSRLVDIHGQHEHQSLLRAEEQRRLLDSWGGHAALIECVGTAHREWRDAEDEHATLASDVSMAAERRELLDFQVSELDALAPHDDELDKLEAEHRRLGHADELLAGLRSITTRLYDTDENSVDDALARAGRELGELQALDAELAPATRVLDEALILLREGCEMLRDRSTAIDLDPARFGEVEERLAALHEASRKFRTPIAGLPALHRQLATELEATGDPEARLAQLAVRAAALAADYRAAAQELTQARKDAARGLGKAVSAAMQQLGMAGGRFAVGLLPLDNAAGSPRGDERIRFDVSANRGQPVLPLGQFASGGELSRISLAIQSVTASGLEIATQVYDEVDVGVGGGIAEIVGHRLRELATHRQVLCITHLPQVAALAHHHLQVSKTTRADETRTAVTAIDSDERVQEIARMLGGVHITEQTRAHAEEMLALAATAGQADSTASELSHGQLRLRQRAQTP